MPQSTPTPTRIRLSCVAVAVTLALVVSALAPGTAAPADATGPRARVIVEFSADPALATLAGGHAAQATVDRLAAASRRADRLRRDHDSVVADAARRGLEPVVVHQLTASFNGMVVEVASDQIEQLEGLAGVAAVHDDAVFQAALADSVPHVGAPDVWGMSDPDGVRATGAGVTVAIVDTGVDYTHPDLGGAFGPGNKVVAGHDYVNDDPDPMDDNGHGTHVAGIVAADGDVRGVAPDATLTAYKVLGASGTGLVSDIIAALDDAVHPDNPHRADVVNLSLSGPGDGTDPLSVAAAHAVDAGVVVVAAAGNVGPHPQTVRSPAAAPGVLAVAATSTGVTVPRARMVAPAQQDLHAVRRDFSADAPTAPVTVDVVDIGEGMPGTYDDVEVAGAAVLVHDFPPDAGLEKAIHAEQRGAVAVLFHVPDMWGSDGGLPGPGPGPGPGPFDGVDPAELADAFAPHRPGMSPAGHTGRLHDLVAVQIPGAAAATLANHLEDGDVRIDLTGVDATDLLATFSSRGPTGSFGAKPDLSAPGVEVYSTLPGGGYGRASGTSMAAPHVAGAAALLRQLQPERSAAQHAAALVGTAHRTDEAGPLDQGAGRLDVAAAARTPVVAAPTTLSFGLADLSSDRLVVTESLTLDNPAGAPATARLTVAAAANLPDAAVTVTPSRVDLPARSEATVEVTVELPRPRQPGDVSGWITVDVGAASPLSVPFLLAVRHLDVHVTPDPVPERTTTSVFVASPADLASAPEVELACPGMPPSRPRLDDYAARLWRVDVDVAGAGVCQVDVTGVADQRYGSPTITGTELFEVAATPAGNNGAAFWQPIGPNSEAGWMGFSDDRNRMTVVPTRTPSVFVTEDRMQTWREVRGMPMAGGTPTDVAIHPDGRRVYVAVNGGLAIDPSYQGRLMASSDRGETWRTLPGPDVMIDQLALDDHGEVLAVAFQDALRITADEGRTWREVPATWSGLQDLHWIGSDLYLATFSGVLVVRDAAGHEPGPAEVLFQPGVLGWAGRVGGDADTLVVSAFPTPWIYASGDGGVSFELILQTTGISIMALELIGDEVYALQPNQLWVGGGRGTEWRQWGGPVSAAVEIDFGRWPNPHPSVADEVYVSSAAAGVYRSSRPDEFVRTGIPAAEVLALAVTEDADGPALVAGTVRDTFRTRLPNRASIRPSDLEWDSSGGEGFQFVSAEQVEVSPSDPAVVFKTQPDPSITFGIYRSDDGGATWDRKTSPSTQPLALLVHPADGRRVYASYWSVTGSGLVVSHDGGDSWRKVHTGRDFMALAGDPADPDRMWAGDVDGLYLSDDAGLSFERVADIPTTAIAIDPDDPDRMIAGGRALHVSRDGGATFERADHAGLDLWISDVVFAGDGSRRAFAASHPFFDELGTIKRGRGVLATFDAGASWDSLTRGLDNTDVTSLALSPDGRYLFAGTLGGSVHRIRLAGGN